MMIDNWKKAWRFWSLRLQAAGIILLAFPELLINAWIFLPAELKSMLPAEYASIVGITLIVLGMIARLIKQRKLDETKP